MKIGIKNCRQVIQQANLNLYLLVKEECWQNWWHNNQNLKLNLVWSKKGHVFIAATQSVLISQIITGVSNQGISFTVRCLQVLSYLTAAKVSIESCGSLPSA